MHVVTAQLSTVVAKCHIQKFYSAAQNLLSEVVTKNKNCGIAIANRKYQQ